MATGARDTEYVFDNAWHEQRRRHAAQEGWLDPGTVRVLEARGVGEGWRCLEVGAGGGSVADWLCRRVGPRGGVLATDLDPRFLAALDHPNLEVRRHDVVADELPEGAYDLVHTRLVLIHLPERQRALERMVRALRPGGWLVAEDIDFGTWAAVPGTDPAAGALWSRMVEAHNRFFAERGAVPDYGRRLLGDLEAQQLGACEAEGRLAVWRGGPGSVGPTLVRLTFDQIGPALVGAGWATEQDLGDLYALLEDPAFRFISPVVMAAWGRRP